MSKRTGGHAAQVVIVLLILFFWGLALSRNWGQFVTYPWQLSWPPIFWAFVALMAQSFVVSTVWWRALALTGERIPWSLGTRLFFQAQIARYLPGGVWDMVGRLMLGSREGIGKRAMAASMGMEMGVQTLSGAIFLLAALILRTDMDVKMYLALGLAVMLGALIFLLPPVFTFFVNKGLKLLKKQPLDMQFTYLDIFFLFLLRLLGHGLMGLGFFLFTAGLTPIPLSQAPLIISAYIGAWLIGFLALMVPMGIGVREGAVVLLSSSVLPFGVATAAGVGYRLLIAIRDLITAGIGFYYPKKNSSTGFREVSKENGIAKPDEDGRM
jgi:hypothetical protein